MIRVVAATALLAAVCIAVVPDADAAETYVVPMWASQLPASDGQWWSQAVVLNPHPFSVTTRVVAVFPLATEDCPACSDTPSHVQTVSANGFAILDPPAIVDGRRLIAGAFEVETSAPVNIHLVAYRMGQLPIRQRLSVARGWLEPGLHSISAVEFAPTGVRLNAFVINPSDVPIEVALWVLNRAENEVRAEIPPRSMRVVTLPEPRCGGAPCSSPDVIPPFPQQVHVESSGSFLAAVSSVARTWAVFSLPDRVDRN